MVNLANGNTILVEVKSNKEENNLILKELKEGEENPNTNRL